MTLIDVQKKLPSIRTIALHLRDCIIEGNAAYFRFKKLQKKTCNFNEVMEGKTLLQCMSNMRLEIEKCLTEIEKMKGSVLDPINSIVSFPFSRNGQLCSFIYHSFKQELTWRINNDKIERPISTL